MIIFTTQYNSQYLEKNNFRPFNWTEGIAPKQNRQEGGIGHCIIEKHFEVFHFLAGVLQHRVQFTDQPVLTAFDIQAE